MKDDMDDDGDQRSEWVADIYHKGKRLRFRGDGDQMRFSVSGGPLRYGALPPTDVSAWFDGELVDYIDAPPPIFPGGAEKHG
jgi:hypothetical protein